MQRRRFGKFILLFLIFAPIAIFVFGSLVMWLWNNVASPVLHLSPVTFWQALGILVLAKILFSSFGGGYRRDYRKERMMWSNMTPEQKEKFREEWRCRRSKWSRPGDSESEMQQPIPGA